MAEEAAAPLLLGNLPDEIVVWEILVRLDPKSLLRCRAVRRAWCRATSTRRFLLAHHARQPSHTIFSSEEYRNILAFDHRAPAAAQLHALGRLDKPFVLLASCDGLLLLSKINFMDVSRTCLSICNPATRQHASLQPLREFNILGMFPHRPTGEYRLLLRQRSYIDSSKYQTGFYVLALGSDEAPRYIGCSETKLASAIFDVPVLLHDSLHWYPLEYVTESEYSKLVILFDTIAESFRQMHAPVVPTMSYIFDMDNMLGLYSCNKPKEIVDIWVLKDYESEVWNLKYRVKLPITEMMGKLEDRDGSGYWYVAAALSDGDVLLLVRLGHWLFYFDIDGKLVASFQDFYPCKHRLKQTLVPHDFFTAREGYAADSSPFI